MISPTWVVGGWVGEWVPGEQSPEWVGGWDMLSNSDDSITVVLYRTRYDIPLMHPPPTLTWPPPAPRLSPTPPHPTPCSAWK